MPFTLSHVVAILPVRRWLPPSALAVGAMVPDAPYYLPLPFSSASTHAWWGALLLGLPAGVLLLVLFHQVLRAPLAELAPAGLRARLPGVARPAPVAVVAGLVAGMATHLLWDAFTQVGGPAVMHWELLRQPVVGAHRVFNVLMYVSSAGGLLILAGWLAHWYRQTPVRPAAPPRQRRRIDQPRQHPQGEVRVEILRRNLPPPGAPHPERHADLDQLHPAVGQVILHRPAPPLALDHAVALQPPQPLHQHVAGPDLGLSAHPAPYQAERRPRKKGINHEIRSRAGPVRLAGRAAHAGCAMLLPASPASAAIPGLQRLVTTSPSNSTGNPKAASATCPAGKNVIGLGGYVTGGNGQVVLTELLPDAMSAKVRAVAYEDASGYDGDWSVTAVAVCADPPPGLQRVSTQSPGDSDAKEWTVTCPNGKKILGLGGRLNGFEGRILLDALQPFGGVSGQLHASEDAAGLSGNWSVTAVAMCADPGTWSRSRNARKPEPGTGDSSIKSSISWMNIHSQARTGDGSLGS